MRCMVVNLPLSHEQRAGIEHEFGRAGLPCELWLAASRFELTDEHRALVDHERRARLGMAALGDASFGCLASHLSLLGHFIESGEDMIAVPKEHAASIPTSSTRSRAGPTSSTW